MINHRLQAERTFLLADLTAFAGLSGDFNPLHTDPIAARRTPFGDCVAHGVFVLMWALDCWHAQSGSRRQWAKISAKFLRPVMMRMKVEASAMEKGSNQIAISVNESGRLLLQCELTLGESQTNIHRNIAASEIPPRETPARPQIKVSTSDDGVMDLFWSLEHGTSLFPALAATQRPDVLASLLASTRIIGMKVPGEHSVFLQLNLEFLSLAAGPSLAFRVAEYRKSSQRLGVAVSGVAVKGMLWVLVRPPPVTQPAMAVIRGGVPPNRFQGKRVIVVGGSRGLGEIASKQLAAGGAEVALTYRLGAEDADRVVADILSQGGKAKVFRLDIGSADLENELEANCSGFNHLCYFPTPPIVGGDGTTFNLELFEKFNAVYVAGFIRAAQWLAKQNAGRFFLFNASSIYVNTPPLRNLEYAASKAASEACGRWLAAAYPQARVYVARFPRLDTDQTSSFLAASEHDSLATMFAELGSWLPIGA